MGDLSTIKAAVAAAIRTNGNQEITGQVLQNTLTSIINTLGTGAQYMGIATPSTNPGTPDAEVFYIASANGTYSNFCGVTVNNEVVILVNSSGSWVKQSTGFATIDGLNNVINQIGTLLNLQTTTKTNLVDAINEIFGNTSQLSHNIENINKYIRVISINNLGYGGAQSNGANIIKSGDAITITDTTGWGCGGFKFPLGEGNLLILSKIKNVGSSQITLKTNIGGSYASAYNINSPSIQSQLNKFLTSTKQVDILQSGSTIYHAEIIDSNILTDVTCASYVYFTNLLGGTIEIETHICKILSGAEYFDAKDSTMIESLFKDNSYLIDKKTVWEGKRILAIGDSVTAMYYDSGVPKTGYGFYSWVDKVGSLLKMNVRKHAEGGIGLIQMVDGHGTDAPSGVDPDSFNNKVYKLNKEDVKDVDVIVLMGMYNEYGSINRNVGVVTDMYVNSTTGNTFMGRLNYAIKRIYEELNNANNLKCKVIICGPHRHGKYPYSDTDAYQKGDLLNDSAKLVADYHSLHYIDLLHRGMINKYNWSIAQKSNVALSNAYISSTGVNDGVNHPFVSLSAAPSASGNKGKLITILDREYAYESNGSSWIYGYITCPWNADQLHPSIEGCNMIGEVIAGEINTILCS